MEIRRLSVKVFCNHKDNCFSKDKVFCLTLKYIPLLMKPELSRYLARIINNYKRSLLQPQTDRKERLRRGLILEDEFIDFINENYNNENILSIIPKKFDEIMLCSKEQPPK